MRRSMAMGLGMTVLSVAACAGGQPEPAPSAPPSSSVAVAPVPASPSAVASVGPTPEPSVVEIVIPASWTGATSRRLHYAIDHPSDWIVTPATEDWPAVHFPYPFGKALDRYAETAENETVVVVTSEPLAPDEDATDRLQELDFVNTGEGSGNSCQLSDRHAITLDGVAARQEDFFCFSDHGIEVAVTEGGRFYMLDMLAKHVLTPTDRAVFDRFVGSFRFD